MLWLTERLSIQREDKVCDIISRCIAEEGLKLGECRGASLRIIRPIRLALSRKNKKVLVESIERKLCNKRNEWCLCEEQQWYQRDRLCGKLELKLKHPGFRVKIMRFPTDSGASRNVLKQNKSRNLRAADNTNFPTVTTIGLVCLMMTARVVIDLL